MSENGVITSEDLAKAMVLVCLNGNIAHEDPVLENRDIRRVASR